MRYFIKINRLVVFILLFLSIPSFWSTPMWAQSQNIQRFEYLSSKDGLSQNTVFNMLCDRKGFLWIGTMNGLNRFDGKHFKIFKSQGNTDELLTNNRISHLWQDEKGYIWMRSYDGFFHCFNQEKERFITLPNYNEQKQNSIATSFEQYRSDIVFVGTSGVGLFMLKYLDAIQDYQSQQLWTGASHTFSQQNNVEKIYTDQQKNLWILAEKGLYQLTESQIESLNFNFAIHHPNISFTNAVAETEDHVWFGTRNNGVLIYQKQEKQFRFLATERYTALAENAITHLVNTGQKQILAGVKNHSAFLIAQDLSEVIPVSFHHNNLEQVYLDGFKQAWLTGSNLGVTRLNLKTLETQYYSLTPNALQSVTDHERHFFFEDAQHNLWIGLHGSGLAAYNRDANQFEFYRNRTSDQASIPSNIVHCIAEDQSGQLWLGTGQYNGGLVKVVANNTAFEHFIPEPHTENITDNVVRYVMEDPRQRIWVATKGGKIHLYQASGKLLHTIPHISTVDGLSHVANIYSMCIDRKGYLWLASKGNGIFVSQNRLNDTDPGLIRFQHLTASPNAGGLSHNNVYSLAEDEWGNIWAATFGKGITRICRNDNGTFSFTPIHKDNSNLSSNQVRYCLVDSKGNLWLATTFGINKLHRNQLKGSSFEFSQLLHSANDKNSISYNDVYHLFEASDHTLWLGTSGGGINHLLNPEADNAQFDIFTGKNGLCNDVVYSIAEDETGNLWIGTENGLSRKAKGLNSFETFNQSNGLPIGSFSEATNCRLSNGDIWFGGNYGFIAIQTDQLQTDAFKGNLELTNFLLFNKDVTVNAPNSPLEKAIGFTGTLHLNHTQSGIAIEYACLDLQAPDHIQYAYILEGLESEWNYVGNQRKAIYTNLSPGKYLFRLKHTLRNGEWNESERTLQIHILPPWYLTWMAFAAYVATIGFIIWLVTRTMMRIQQYRHELQLEKKVNEIKLQFFTNISHEIRTPLTLIVGPLEDILQQNLSSAIKRQLQIIQQNAQRMLLLTNQLLDFRKVQNNKMKLCVSQLDAVEFTRHIVDSFQLLANHKHISLQFESNCTEAAVWADVAKLDIIVYNLLSNALKFTPENKSIQVKVLQQEAHTCVSVIDQGPGIPAEALPELFTRYTILSNNQYSGTGIGLSLSYELARLHKGELTVNSEPGVGSKFTLQLPNGKAHLEQNPMILFAASHEDLAPWPALNQTDDADNEYTGQNAGYEPVQKVLVVEDHPEILNYICQSLHHRYRCIKASNGEEGLWLARREQPNLIVTDVMMPIMDGLEMIKSIKEDFQISHIPIVALTAKVSLHDELEGIRCGAEAYLQKPFNAAHLLAVADNLIKQREQIRARFGAPVPQNQLHPQPQVQVTSKDEEFMTRLVQFVEHNYKTEFSIDHIAENFAVSRTVFYNKVKGLTGLSPLEFVRQIKLNIASQLLLKGFNVSEVAFEIGYSDVKYFSRQFKTQFGTSPSQYKHDTDHNSGLEQPSSPHEITP